MKGRVTKTGYRRNSPDVNNDYNIIPSNRISMAGVDFPVLGIDNLGNAEVMYPGGEYEFQGDYVTELPTFGSGGLTQWFAEEWVDIKTGKKCGRSGKDKNGRPYPACRPSKRVNKTTPKTSKEMSAKEKAKFKKSKTSKKRINYNHKRAQEGVEVEPEGYTNIYGDYIAPGDTLYSGAMDPAMLRFQKKLINHNSAGQLQGQYKIMQEHDRAGDKMHMIYTPYGYDLPVPPEPVGVQAVDLLKEQGEKLSNFAKGIKFNSPFKKQEGGPVGTYSVKPGDTFYGIANRQSVDKNALVNANPDLDIDNLKVGQSIQLPGINKNYALRQGKVVSMSPELYEKTPDFYKNPKLDKPDLQKSNTNLFSFDNPRSKALLEAAKKVSEGQGGRPLEVLLNMTAVMENSLGNNPKAYGRDYTRSQMSIDDNAYADLFEPRGEYDYTSSQKKGFEWLKGMGYEPAKMDSILRTDDPVAAMATARLVYGRAPGALPNPDDPKEIYSYYMNNYNKSGALKYGNDKEHYKRFLDAYNNLYQKENGGESIPVYNTYKSKNRAWLAARKNLGRGKQFMYGGKVYSTSTPNGL